MKSIRTYQPCISRWICFVVFVILLRSASAATVAVELGAEAGTSNSSDWAAGFRFTVTTNINVTDLGKFDHEDDGINGNGDVGLYNVDSLVRLATVTIPAEATAETNGSVAAYYASITPVALTTGTTYAVYSVSEGSDDKIKWAQTMTMAAEVNYVLGVANSGAALPGTYAQTHTTGSGGYMGGTFKFDVGTEDILLDNSTVASNAVPGALVGTLSVTNETPFVYALDSGGDNDYFDIPSGTNQLRTATWLDKGSFSITVIAAETGGSGLVFTNDTITVTTTDGGDHAAFEVDAEVKSGIAAGDEVVGILKARGAGDTSFGFSITSGRDDLFEITSVTNLTQVAGSDPGPLGTVNYVELQATNSTKTIYLIVGVEVANGSGAGTLFFFQ